MRILLLSAYDAASHRYWRQLLQDSFCDYDWTVLTLPPRYFSWRVRGNSLSWAFAEREVLEREYDLLMVTSMVDLSALRGFVPALAAIPTLVYFHENQFAYPASEEQYGGVEPQVLSLYTALAADTVVFNSVFNRDTFLSGVGDLLKRLPDAVPTGIEDLLLAKSEVLPVPLASEWFAERSAHKATGLQLLWNHRWEYDKGPDRLLAILQQLDDEEVELTLHIVGQQFRRQPAAFADIQALIESSVSLRQGQWGFIEDSGEYRALLRQADMVLSTAVHDFQGLSVLEAVAAGCIPVVPDRLAYPEWFGPRYRYPSFPDDVAAEAKGAVASIRQLCSGEGPLVPDIAGLDIAHLRESYEALFQRWVAVGQERGE